MIRTGSSRGSWTGYRGVTQQCVKWTFHNRACWRGCLLSSDDMGGPTAAAYQWGPPARSLKRRVGRVSGDIGKVLCSWRTVDQCRVLSARNLSSRYTPRLTVRFHRTGTNVWLGRKWEGSFALWPNGKLVPRGTQLTNLQRPAKPAERVSPYRGRGHAGAGAATLQTRHACGNVHVHACAYPGRPCLEGCSELDHWSCPRDTGQPSRRSHRFGVAQKVFSISESFHSGSPIP